MRKSAVKSDAVDLAGFEAWLRDQLKGPSFAALLVVILQMVRALFEENVALRMRIMGKRLKPPSERLAVIERQLSFAFAVPSNDVTPAPAGSPPPAPNRPPPKPRAKPQPRGPIASHLFRVDVPNNVPADQRWCSTCQVEMTPMKCRIVETIELIPARIVVHRRHDERLACPRCDAIVSASAPPSVCDGGLLGPTLVTEALCAKVLEGLPIERQARAYQRQGAPIAASTLGRAVARLLEMLVMVAARILDRVRHSEHVQLDSTGLRVLAPKTALGTVRDTLWVLIGDGLWVYFAALEEGTGDALEELLGQVDVLDFQCDGTSVTNFVETKLRRRRPGCHSHGRRRLAEAARQGDFRALEGLRIYQQLFVIEQRAKRAGLDTEARQRLREAESVPVLEAMKDWVLQLAPSVEPKSKLGEGLTYLQRQWFRLYLFVHDGAIELTNNRSERELRPWVQGQHSWLFMGDHESAQGWTAAYSLVHTALAHGLNPRAYLHALVARLLAGHPHTRIDELLPDAMLRADPSLADPLQGSKRARAGPGSHEDAA